MRVFVAGATGALGKPLVPRLIGRGHEVFGMTKSDNQVELLQHQGARGVVVDAFDAAALREKLSAIEPEAIVHLLTDLPFGLPAAQMTEGTIRNAKMRSEGTRNLVDAAVACGVRKMVAASIAWVYGAGREPHAEDEPIDVNVPEPAKTTRLGVVDLERSVLHSSPLAGVVLRNGHIYGPGTGQDIRDEVVSVHVDAAADAAMLALEDKVEGIFNIVDDNDCVSNAKARQVLGWSPTSSP